LLRLDVNGATGYAIPADNPYNSDTSFAPEVWSYGLRNPWRFSFDRSTGDLYIGDVGQDTWEEVDVSPTAVQRGRGVNFGWNIMEGRHCYPNAPCDSTHSVLPVLEYPHVLGGCAVTGGYVYRGAAFGQRQWWVSIFYADFCNGEVTALPTRAGRVSSIGRRCSRQGPTSASFWAGRERELYILQLSGKYIAIAPSP